MDNYKSLQIEQYIHREGNNIYQLNKINAEIITFLEGNEKLEKIFGGIKEYRNKLFMALGAPDYKTRIATGKELMRDLWEIEIGLGAYPFADLLSRFEFGGKFYHGYRDHVLHQLKVYLLGLYLFWSCKSINKLITAKMKESVFLIQWKIAALAHDNGYIFEIEESAHDPWILNKVIPIFNHSSCFPLSTISSRSKKNDFKNARLKILKDLHNDIAKRTFTVTKEKKLQELFDIAIPRISTIQDFKKFKNENLFNYLHVASTTSKLSYAKKNGIEAYYEFAALHGPNQKRSPSRDHGISSALFLLYQLKCGLYYANKLSSISKAKLIKSGLSPEHVNYIRGFSHLIKENSDNIISAAEAVALHNISFSIWDNTDLEIADNDYKLSLNDYIIPHEEMPLAFLLYFVDILQNWDRPSFDYPENNEHLEYQSDQDISIVCGDKYVHVCCPNNLDALDFFYKSLCSKIERSLDGNFVKELIKPIRWNAVGKIVLSKEAKAIEDKLKPIRSPKLSFKLKDLFSLEQKTDYFEYRLTLDLINTENMLRLLKDLVAFSNSGGGVLVVGISEVDFELKGIPNQLTKINIHQLIETINIYCSKPLDFNIEIKKVLLADFKPKKFEKFLVFAVEPNKSIIYLTKNGTLKNISKTIFKKYSVPIRENSRTIFANNEYHLKKIIDAKKNNNIDLLESYLEFSKHINLPEHVYGIEFPPPLPGNLPYPDCDNLIGRKYEIGKIISFLNNSKKPTLTIDGIGGSGKSALALDVAWNIKYHLYKNQQSPYKIEADFEAVIWVTAKTCELTADGIKTKFSLPITLDLLLDSIAEALGFPELIDSEFEDKKNSVIEFTKEMPVIVFIDNLETIPESQVDEIIRFAEEELPLPSKAIYTTRTKFHEGYSERVLELNPKDAILLGKEIALEHNQFDIIFNSDIIQRICDRTGRIPLGLKWVIARISMGFHELSDIDMIKNDQSLLEFCFKETFEILKNSERNILFAVAKSDFELTISHLEFVTGMSKKEVLSNIDRLESLSLVKKQFEKITILPLTKDYALQVLAEEEGLYPNLSSKFQELYQIDPGIDESLPVNKRMAMKNFRHAEYDAAQGNLSEAKLKLEKALKLSYESFILKALGEVYDRLKDQKNALKYYELYLEKNPKDKNIHIKLAHRFAKEGKYDKALLYFNSATNLEKNDPNLWHFKGLTEVNLYYKKYRINPSAKDLLIDAIQSFKKAIRQKTNLNHEKYLNAINYHLMSKCYFWLGEIDNAKENNMLGLQEVPGLRKLISFRKRIEV